MFVGGRYRVITERERDRERERWREGEGEEREKACACTSLPFPLPPSLHPFTHMSSRAARQNLINHFFTCKGGCLTKTTFFTCRGGCLKRLSILLSGVINSRGALTAERHSCSRALANSSSCASNLCMYIIATVYPEVYPSDMPPT